MTRDLAPAPKRAAAFGHTLLELLVVITIIAILASGSIYLLKGQIDSAKDTRVDSDLQAIGLALQSYESRALRKPTTEQARRSETPNRSRSAITALRLRFGVRSFPTRSP